MLCLAPFVFAWSAQVSADETAQSHYLHALELFNQGQYVDALERLNRAIELRPEPVDFCNRAAVLLQLGNTRDALESMKVCREGFVDAEPEEFAQVDAEYRALALVVKHIAPATRAVASVIAFERDRPASVPRELGPATEEPAMTGMEVAAWSTGAVGALSLAGALVVDVVTLPLIDEYREVAREGRERSSYTALKRAIDQRQILIGSLLIGGVVSVVTSAVLFSLDGAPAEDPSAQGVSIHFGGSTLAIEVLF